MVLRLLFISFLLAIAYMSLIPSESVNIGNDKIGHFIAYMILMFNAGLIFFKKKKKFLLAILFCATYGLFIEFLQQFVPGRFMSLEDFIANTIGVIFGILLTYLFFRPIIQLLKSMRII